jgi:hypothetical protein
MKNLYKQFLIIFAFLISSVGLKAQISGDTTLCPDGNQTNYTCLQNASSYNWTAYPSGDVLFSDSNVQNPDVVFSNTPGTYTLEVTTTSPNNIYTLIVTIQSTPQIYVSTNNATGCLGDAVTLTATATGGNDSSYTFSWGTTPSIIQTGDSSSVNVLINSPVVVTYILTVSNGCSNPESVVVNVTGNSLTSISGTALSNSPPITAGQVCLYSLSQGTTDTTNLNASGQYTFTSVPAGDYIIKCIPDSTTYPTLIETYYGDVAAWYLADTIHHDCISNSVADIHVIEPILMPGPGTISGTIIEGFGFGSRLINSNTEVQVPGGPLKDIDVNLVSLTSNTVVAQTTSDFNGYYEFSNVAVGDYTLQVDILGLPMDSSYYIIIDPLLFSTNVNQTTSSVFTNLDFVADNTAIYITNSIGIKQNEINENGISIYPNPAKNKIFINTKNHEGKKVVQLINSLGEIVKTETIETKEASISLDNLNAGLYIIKIISKDFTSTNSLIIQN